MASTSLVIDRSGPSATGATAGPNPTQGAAAATMSAVLTDASTAITAGEWFVGSDPGPGNGTALAAADGVFDATTEAVRGTVSLAGRPFGELVVSVRGRDAAGTWGPATSAVIGVTPTDGVFADGFESAAADRWSSRTGTTRLSVTAAAAMAGRYGLRIAVSGGTSAYVTDTTPSGPAYDARFGFDARGLATPARPSTSSPA